MPAAKRRSSRSVATKSVSSRRSGPALDEWAMIWQNSTVNGVIGALSSPLSSVSVHCNLCGR